MKGRNPKKRVATRRTVSRGDVVIEQTEGFRAERARKSLKIPDVTDPATPRLMRASLCPPIGDSRLDAAGHNHEPLLP
jgi:hypothetical protein